MTRPLARSPRGQRAVVEEPFHSGSNVSVISAPRLDGVACSMMIDGAIDTDVVKAYVEVLLVPALRRGDSVVWDNVPMHCNADVRAAIEAAGADVIALPTYSPDLNPIEECISKIKAYLRRAKARTKLTLQRALKRAIEMVTPADCAGWFQHAEYNLL